jgi:spermidine synthase
VKESLMDVGFGTTGGVAIDLLATYAGRAAELGEWMKGAQINTDWNLRLQYLAGMSLNTYKGPAILSEILKYCRFPSDVFVGSEVYVEAMKQRLAAAGRH